MDMKSMLIQNTVFKYERDSGIRLDYSELEKRLISILTAPQGQAPQVTYTMSLEEAIKFEIYKDPSVVEQTTRGVMHQVTLEEKEKEDKALNEAAQAIADQVDSEIIKEVLPEVVTPSSDQMRLYMLSEKLLGLHEPPFELTDNDKKLIRVSYQRFVGSKSLDEFDDLKTLIETFKAVPDELDEELPKLKPVIDKVVAYYE